MAAREFTCKVIQKKWLTPTVVELRFEPQKKFSFEPGQFVSVIVPPPGGASKPLRRAYSLSVAPEEGWGLCVKIVPGGPGSNYMASLKEGESFKLFAPYGDFLYDAQSGRNVCFVSTGTGIAPFLSMIHSKAFRENPPPSALNLFGAWGVEELLYAGHFEAQGIREVHAISRPQSGYIGFNGRVTDYLRSLPADWAWHSTDFYLCGHGQMVADVVKHLSEGRGVPAAHIHKEVYFVTPQRRGETPAKVINLVMPPPFRKVG